MTGRRDCYRDPSGAGGEGEGGLDLDIVITGLLGVDTDPRHVIAYADGEVRQEFNITFSARSSVGRSP